LEAPVCIYGQAKFMDKPSCLPVHLEANRLTGTTASSAEQRSPGVAS